MNIGFVGSGDTATKHAEVIKCFKNYSILSVFSKNKRNAQKFAKKFNIKNFYSKFDLFKNNHKYDLIFVCLPPEKLLTYIKLLFRINSNIFIEKPLGLNLNEAKKILNLFKKKKFKKNKFFVGYNRRFLGSVMKLKSILSNQSSKRFLTIEDQQDLNKAKSFGHNKKTLQNWMYANSIHTIDFFSYLLRGQLKISNIKKIKFKKSYIIYCNFNSSSGDEGRYIGYWNIPSSWSVSLVNDENILKLNPLEVLIVKNKNKNQIYDNFKNDKKFKPGFYEQFKEIDKAIKNKKNYAVTIFDAIKSVRTINKIYEKFR